MIYENYFDLSKRPFSIAPNPHFLFAQGQYREAMAALEFAMVHRGGFVLLTGEVGTGKTTLCKHLLQHIPEDTELALILHPQLDRIQLLRLICREFDLQVTDSANELELIEQLTEFLLSVYAKGGYSVLIIDEAQHLDFEVLELIRLLTNLETHEDKLLQIILLGQPELKTRLERHDLRQLNQRFTARYHLKPLSPRQVSEYVDYRIQVAGSRKRLFSGLALRQLAKYSGGVPRLINVIADRSLMGAYAEERQVVSAGIVKRAAKEVLPEATKKPLLNLSISKQIALPFLVILMIAGLFLYGQAPLFNRISMVSWFDIEKPECEECWQGMLPASLIDENDWVKQGGDWQLLVDKPAATALVYTELSWPFAFPKSVVVEPNEYHEAVSWVRQSLIQLQGQASLADDWEVIRPANSAQIRRNFFDPLLEDQVRQFQSDYALRVDGIIGSQTIMALSRATRRTKNTGG
ncbi:AAA family ATPase [Bermanella marisrubri]|uniref:General secretion pathway protein A n=1 Tax=Bermanella marisrubri TaxID=207949 RepID=Q1MXT9_9GAMM|nr:ExeA family protein [Bermanella marisrubri]EAT10798.1 general secretion pathway protein A [Oceanobacter sp. RED65] [Bermanella marisrubri]QIZ84260.1 AAA family ATPase [Bermanella marisrubri]